VGGEQMKKKLTSFLLLLIAFCLAGCGNSNVKGSKAKTEHEETTIDYLAFTGSVYPAELAEDLGYLDPIKLNLKGFVNGGPESIQAAATGETDFGGAFNGAIIKLLATNANVEWVINYYGTNEKTFFGAFITEDSEIKTARDLIGKKIAMNTLGAHGEFIVKEYLRKNGLTEKEIKKVTLLAMPPINIEQALRNGQIDVGLINGALQDKALERGGLKLLFSDYDLYGTFSAGGYVLNKDFAKENPNTAKKFVEGVAKAIEWSKTTPREEVIARMEKIMKERNKSEDTSALKYWKSYGVATEGGVIQEKEAQMWIKQLEQEGQLQKGQVKATNLFTNKYNPYAKK
jgi:ABC-type nitrate/sulfonate/bicarbonate transport system substrate-binding protein